MRSLLILGASLAVIAAATPGAAQSVADRYSAEDQSTSVSDARSETYVEQSGAVALAGGRSHADQSGAYAHEGYQQGYRASGYEERAYDSESQSSSYRSDAYAFERRASAVHRTTDAAGFLSWAGKAEVYDGDAHADRDWRGGGDHGGCPVGHGERVLSCRYIPFEPVVRDQPLTISDEDFAYEGSVGPMVAPDGGGGGGGGGGGFAVAGGSAFAGASASASASASVSASVNIHGHFGGHYGGGGWGHMGGHYGGGGYHGGGWGHMGGGGGHMKSGCGCSKK